MQQTYKCEVYFNSIKVRLELGSTIASGYQTLFQFHKGTIRTSVPSEPSVPSAPYFNSIKVRLELYKLELIFNKAIISIP